MRFLPSARAKAIKQQMLRLQHQVDAFYDLLSEKNWILHDHLSLTVVEAILAEAHQDADRAEAMLIDHYHDRDRLSFMIRLMRKLPAMRRRLALIDKAQEDYFAGRYYACVHVLLSVMDGFVNEVESVRRGLHAREAKDLHTWDSVVGHHRGLAHAHKTFAKGCSATQEEPVHELYRNGIVHGSILNYDNIIVATKAWNRLFAVADWASAREKEQQHSTAEPFSWSALAGQFKDAAASVVEQGKIKDIEKQWTPREHLPGSADFAGHPARERTESLLTWWRDGNYGSLSDLITQEVHTKHGKAVRSKVRRAYQDHPLTTFDILAVRHDMPAACTVTARLHRVDSSQTTVSMRWIREDEQAQPKPEPWPGEWRLWTWEPLHLFARASD
ncbi:hypothetical protein GCM10010365_76030 [Streptomyces poonensis]|uniref:Uncharacterized protein n=1 Tax=Streptomyces poonensis TaxID=68255 RepID=A0A918QEJ0_9ACTN|nr:hypothetical protein GCM10010365_76030 [Streptomyces poonensis]